MLGSVIRAADQADVAVVAILGMRGVDVRALLDGTSVTLMVVESTRLVPWTKPADLAFTEGQPTASICGSRHPGGFHVVFADGSSRFLKSDLDPALLRSLITRDGNEFGEG